VGASGESTFQIPEELEERLKQLETLASVGTLTAGIIHELRNPLNFINNFSVTSVELIEELKEALEPHLGNVDARQKEEILTIAGDLAADIETIRKHGKRAESIINNMLAFARQGASAPTLTDLHALLKEAMDLAYHSQQRVGQGFQVNLETHFENATIQLCVIPHELVRVLINLLSNAFFATQKKMEGQNEAGSYQPTVSVSTQKTGGGVEITIRDNGMGIPADNLGRLFTPFFTTKPTHQGTGLGLSICHEIIVDHHGGQIHANSIEGEFAEFTIWLPETDNCTGAGSDT